MNSARRRLFRSLLPRRFKILAEKLEIRTHLSTNTGRKIKLPRELQLAKRDLRPATRTRNRGVDAYTLCTSAVHKPGLCQEVSMSGRHRFSTLLILATTLSMFGCGRHDSDEKYFLVADNVQLPYWQEAKSGFT